MTPFLHLLSLYYACDALAADYVLPPAKATECSAIYREIKLTFVDNDPSRLREGYLAFKAWEGRNPDIVRRLRM